jgi:hypothetical protein
LGFYTSPKERAHAIYGFCCATLESSTING